MGMKIAIIGPGAVGSLFAAYLQQAGHEVTLLDHHAARASQLNSSGISVRGVRGDLNVAVPVSLDASQVGPAELVMVAVKAYRTDQALRQHLELVSPESMVLTLQNGLGNVESIARVVPEAQIVAGSTTLGTNLLGPGRVHHAGEGDTVLGELSGKRSERVDRLARVLGSAGFVTLVSEEIQRVIWTKLLVNVGINALTALLWVRNGALVEHGPIRALMRDLVAEAVTVAASQGFEFDLDNTLAKVEEVARRTAQNRSSMLADMQAGRRTEIDYINGAIAGLGDAPVNRTLTDLVRGLEATAPQRQQSSG